MLTWLALECAFAYSLRLVPGDNALVMGDEIIDGGQQPGCKVAAGIMKLVDAEELVRIGEPRADRAKAGLNNGWSSDVVAAGKSFHLQVYC